MNILSSLFKPKTQPKPVPAPVEVVIKQTYHLEQGALVIEADTLDAYHKASSSIYEAQSLLEAAVEVEKLKRLDQKEPDFDPRPQHVVLPKHKFEYHGDTKQLQGQYKEAKVQGDDRELTISGHPTFGDRLGGYQAVWNRQDDTLLFSSKKSESPAKPVAAPTGSVLHDEQFSATPEGKVVLPGAQSLAEAAQVAPRRERASRADDLLRSAEFWQQTGLSYDGTELDASRAWGNVVAPEITPDMGDENVMSRMTVRGGEDGMEDVACDYFDVQASKKGDVLVYGGSGELSAQSSPEGTTVTFKHYNEVEQVRWSRADGSVSYKKSRFQSQP